MRALRTSLGGKVRILIIMSLGLGAFACVENSAKEAPKRTANVAANSGDAKTEPKVDTKAPDAKVISGPNARKLCTRPASIPKNPETFDDVIRLLNALPKPVSVPCFLDTLDPPFFVNATSNIFSGQPAGSSHSPRIFLFVGKALVISVVPSGVGANMIEFSFRLNPDESVKGELEFPVTEPLAMDAPYTHILNFRKDQTLCVTCHFPEKPAPEGFPATAFASRFVSALEDYDVSVEAMQKLNETCKKEVGDYCGVIQALFFRGKVQGVPFDR